MSTVGNGQTGTVMMATQYNVSSAPFADKESMLQYHGSQSSRMIDFAVHGVECDPKKLNSSKLYVRTGPAPVAEDIKTYDHGQFNIAFIGIPNGIWNSQIGELWVEYKIKLRKARFYTNRGMAAQRDIFYASTVSNATIFWNTADINSQYKGQQNNIGCSLSSPIANQLIIGFPNQVTGYFKIIIQLEGSGLTGNTLNHNTTTTPTVTGNVAVCKDIFATSYGAAGKQPSYFYTNLTATQGHAEFDVYVQAATGGTLNTIILTTGVTAGTTSNLFISIAEANPIFLRSQVVSPPIATVRAFPSLEAASPNWVRISDGLAAIDPSN